MTSQFRSVLLGAVCGLCAAAFSSAALATSINYGDFGPDLPSGTTIYEDVRESSGTDPVPPPGYGAPTLVVDLLAFSPPGISASSSGSGVDITDGQLNFDISTLEVNNVFAGGLTSLAISESGDYSLSGTGTSATTATAAVSATVEILEVDGVAITPISIFATSSVGFDLATDGPAAGAAWSTGLMVDLAAALASNSVSYTYGVTKAAVVVNNQLAAVSEVDSTASLAKRSFVVEPGVQLNPSFVIPEPASALMALTMVAGLARRRRR